MKKHYRIILIILTVVIAIRIAIPYIIEYYINKTLSELKEFNGHISDIDLALIRGAYNLEHIYMTKRDTVTQKETEFFKARSIDLSIEWGALFKGKVVGKIFVEEPKLIFTKDKAEPRDLAKDTVNFRRMVKRLMPLKINRLEIENGALHYVDSSVKPMVNVFLSEISIIGHNLSNIDADKKALPSDITLKSSVYGGSLVINIRLDALAKKPKFDLNAELLDTDLVKLNDFFKAYGNFDVAGGRFNLYTEVAAMDGKFKGYMKPLIKDLKVISHADKDDSNLRKLWESIIAASGELLQNQKKEQVATKLPFEGSFKNPDVGILAAVIEIMSNAFIQALIPSLDYEINLKSVNEEEDSINGRKRDSNKKKKEKNASEK